MKILMVCLGNICRSPLAEGILAHRAAENGLKWEIDSAGIGNWHVGKAPHHLSQKVARKYGIDISTQRGRQLQQSDFSYYDRVYFMDSSVYDEACLIAGKEWDQSRCRLLLDEVFPGERQSVPDPYGFPEKEFELVFEMIDAACQAIVAGSAAESVTQKEKV